MRRFKPGQKVVYDDKGKPPKNIEWKAPANGEVVTIIAYCYLHNDHYFLLEYPCGKGGREQCCTDRLLHPLKSERELVHHKLSMPVPQLPEIIEETVDVPKLQPA